MLEELCKRGMFCWNETTTIVAIVALLLFVAVFVGIRMVVDHFNTKRRDDFKENFQQLRNEATKQAERDMEKK